MSVPDLPIPAELAVEQEPIAEHELAAYFAAVQNDADAAAVDPEVAAEWLAADDSAQSLAARVARWRIEADDQAEWALRKLAVANEELRRFTEQAQEWANRIHAWFLQASREHERTASFMRDRLEDYGLRRREAGGGATLTLPSGTIRTTASGEAVEVENDEELYVLLEGLDGDALVEWSNAMANAEVEQHELTKRSVKIDVRSLRKLVRIEHVHDGNELTIEYACGHVVTFDYFGSIEEVPERGEVIGCAQCPMDPIEGVAQVAVARAELSQRTKPVVLGPDGSELKGVRVRPARIVPKVEAR